MNPYQVLQLPQTSTYTQIKQRYRHLSKMIHPDKQPIENYQLAQAHFKEIDEAYKAISSELRRYVYKRYGAIGIGIVEGNGYRFAEYQGADLGDPEVVERLNQLMLYCMYEESASTQIDKNVLRNKSVVMVFKPINQINQLPSIDRSEYSFETSLPDFWGMTHTASITHQSQGLNSQTKSSMTYGLGSTKRISESLMLTAQTQVNNQKFALQAGFDKVVSPNMVLHFIPVQFVNGQMQGLQVGADFHSDGYTISGVTNFNDFTVQIGSSPMNKIVTKYIKFGFDGDAFMVAPYYERELSSRVRAFVQLHIKGEKVPPLEPNSSNVVTLPIGFGFAYGYKLKIQDQLKLELTSFISPTQSSFQLGILTPKFKAHIPILSRSDILTFQLYKLGAFLTIYLTFQLYGYYSRRWERVRRRLEHENYNRLAVEKNAVAKNNSDLWAPATQSREAEGRYGGLVVLVGYIGSRDAIARVRRQINAAINLKQPKHDLNQVLQIAKRLTEQIPTNETTHTSQLYLITQTLQAQIKGGQLPGYLPSQLRVNPCIDQKQPYYSLTCYYMREKVFLLERVGTEEIKIGGMKARYRGAWWKRFGEWVRGKIVN